MPKLFGDSLDEFRAALSDVSNIHQRMVKEFEPAIRGGQGAAPRTQSKVNRKLMAKAKTDCRRAWQEILAKMESEAARLERLDCDGTVIDGLADFAPEKMLAGSIVHHLPQLDARIKAVKAEIRRADRRALAPGVNAGSGNQIATSHGGKRRGPREKYPPGPDKQIFDAVKSSQLSAKEWAAEKSRNVREIENAIKRHRERERRKSVKAI